MTPKASDLKIAVEQTRAWGRRLTITVPAERVQRQRQDVARRLAGSIRLPGFRKGRVPTRVLERKFGAAIDQEAIEQLVGDAYREALEQEALQPISQGEVENVSYEPGQDLSFDVEFEVRPEIELERLGGFTVKREQAEVTDEDVDRMIERLREQNAVWSPVESGTPLDGDMVVVEITSLGAESGEGEEEAKPRQYQIVLGEDQAVPAVEDAIRTLEPDREEEFTLELPDPESEEEGATRTDRVRIRLVEAQRPELPELDDAFASSLGDFETVADLRERVRTDLEAEAEREAERGVRSQLLDQILDANPFEVPDTLVNQYLEQLLPSREGEDSERLLEARQVARPAAEQALRRMMVIERIAELESLAATSDEVDTRVEEIAESNDRPVGEVWAQLQRSGRLAALEEEITEDKVFEYLKSQSTIE